jgi:hypothetical protein
VEVRTPRLPQLSAHDLIRVLHRHVLQAGQRWDQLGPAGSRGGACLSRQQLSEPGSPAAPRGGGEEFEKRANVGKHPAQSGRITSQTGLAHTTGTQAEQPRPRCAESTREQGTVTEYPLVAELAADGDIAAAFTRYTSPRRSRITFAGFAMRPRLNRTTPRPTRDLAPRAAGRLPSRNFRGTGSGDRHMKGSAGTCVPPSSTDCPG